MKKCQYSMEFLIFFALLSILFVIWLVIYSDLNSDAVEGRNRNAAMDLGKSIQKQIFLASNSHTGYKSDYLEIPKKAGSLDINISKGDYTFSIRAANGDYTFNIPYTIGNLNYGKNILWSVNGVVCIGDNPCIVDSFGKVRFSQCSDGIDNDGDNLTDRLDGGCYYNYASPEYDWTKDSEEPHENTPPSLPNEVYNYYPLCKKIASGTAGIQCSEINTFDLGFTRENCITRTYEGFCETS